MNNWIERAEKSHAQCSLRTHDPQYATTFVEGKGSFLWDAEGNKWLDLISGYSATNFGHAHKSIATAAQTALRSITHLTGDLHPWRIQLAEKLLEKLWDVSNDGRVIFNSTGARAIETALKAATSFRPGKILALSPNFHGRSIATSALSKTQQTVLSATFQNDVLLWDEENFPTCDDCSAEETCTCCKPKLERLVEFISQNADSLSCILVDPAVTARGYLLPSSQVNREIALVSRKLGIVLIADEIQSGLGRCGAWLRCRAQNWVPQIVVLGKSLGAGVAPISAVVGKSEILNSIPSGAESETFAATPIACRIALESIRLLEDGIMKNGMKAGTQIRQTLAALLDNTVAAITGEGAVCVLDFGNNLAGTDMARKFVDACCQLFIRVQLTGVRNNRVVLLPPLTIDEIELKEASLRLEGAIRLVQPTN